MLHLENSKASYAINIPTSPDEINVDVLKELTACISLPDYYCIIGLRYKISIFNLAMQSKSANKKQLVSVVPILAKVNEEQLKFACKIGQRVIIDPSEVERGSHLGINTAITPDNIANYITSDEELNKKCINRTLGDLKDDTIYCLEFKIVPISALKGSIEGNATDPFKEHFKKNG